MCHAGGIQKIISVKKYTSCAGAYTLCGVIRNSPDSGNGIAKSKGVLGDEEAEGSSSRRHGKSAARKGYNSLKIAESNIPNVNE